MTTANGYQPRTSPHDRRADYDLIRRIADLEAVPPGTDPGPLDPELAAIATLTSSANQAPYFTGSGTAALMTVTASGRALLDDTTVGAMRITLGVTVDGIDASPVVAAVRRPISAQTGTTFAPTIISVHENKMITLSNAAAITVTMPSDATSNFPVGAEIDFLWLGAGQPSFVAGSGATVNGTPGLKLRAQYSKATTKKIAANAWVAYGDLST